MDFIRYPQTVKLLVQELIRACDAYVGREITEQDFKALVHSWAKKSGDKLFDGASKFNPTVVQRLGKKRLRLVLQMLDLLQESMFNDHQ